MRTIIRIIGTVALMAAVAVGSTDTYAATQTKSKKKSATTQVAAKKQSTGKQSTAKQSGTKQSGKKQTGKKQNAPQTAAEAQRRQEAAQKEIKLTEQQIKENDAAVRKNVTELGKLSEEIKENKKLVVQAGARVNTLEQQIETLETDIDKGEKELVKLREEYLKAVKKMRTRKRGNSTLAFIFSSSSFNEAMQRMRYLRQFSAWREKQTADIKGKVATLKQNRDQLDASRRAQARALDVQVKAQHELDNRYARQDAIVVELKRNGQALKTHLANKQQEANALRSTVATLIAREQAKAEEQRRREEEQARQREEKARAERERKEQLAQAETAAKAEEPKKQETKKQETKKQETKKQEPAKKTDKKEKKTAKPAKKEEGSVSYADARKRKPRNTDSQEPAKSENVTKGTVQSKTTTQTVTSGGGFESMRGSLPRPVSGAFKVTGRFGRHALPELPDVVYDNPGIDAEVAAGATAQAVYGGKVSGVYMIPGFHTVVIVSHGTYYTVYGNIAQAGVKVGDVVKQGAALGRLAPDEDDAGKSVIHFEVWKNREKLDPMGWIR